MPVWSQVLRAHVLVDIAPKREIICAQSCFSPRVSRYRARYLKISRVSRFADAPGMLVSDARIVAVQVDTFPLGHNLQRCPATYSTGLQRDTWQKPTFCEKSALTETPITFFASLSPFRRPSWAPRPAAPYTKFALLGLTVNWFPLAPPVVTIIFAPPTKAPSLYVGVKLNLNLLPSLPFST